MGQTVFGLGGIGLAFLAGVLSLLSPCVLPLLPLLLGAGAQRRHFSGAALALGVVTSFVGVGLLIALAGLAIGLDRPVFRRASALLLAAFGFILLSDALHQRFASAASSLSSLGARLAERLQPHSLRGFFVLGLALGGVWSPCVGPTLGAASMLAAQGRQVPDVALVLTAFALGVSLPLVAVGHVSREVWRRWRGTMHQASRTGEPLLGAACLLVAFMSLTGTDHWLEARLLALTPDWLLDLTTRY